MIQRLMMKYLQRKGWIVFWLDEPARFCPAAKEKPPCDCWLALYLQENGKHFE